LGAVGGAVLGAGLTIHSALWSIVGAVVMIIGLAMLVAAIVIGLPDESPSAPKPPPTEPVVDVSKLVASAHHDDDDLGALMDGSGTDEAGPSGGSLSGDSG
jgi:hypothetical protein